LKKEDFKEEIEKLKEQKHKSAIYYFKIKKNKIENKDILEKLVRFKEQHNKKYACPKTKKTDKESSEIEKTEVLYCGSKKQNLHERLNQHLGFGAKSTYSLQLFHWATELNLELDFY
jgi:hypothetical protein